MARIDNKLLKDAKGSYADAVIYTMDGQTYVRSKPAQYKDRKSIKQLVQRQKMTLVNDFLRPFSELIKLTFAMEAEGKRMFAKAQSYNLKNGLSGIYPDQKIDKAKALLSKGSLLLPAEAKVTLTPDGLLFTWSTETEPEYAHANDTLLVIIRRSDSLASDYSFTGVKRCEGSFLWKAPWTDSSPRP
ncbi:hypothetical protein E9993_23425, partial [Labilibacter sediminis]